jgi:succinate dehydrogenase/fumarate reductase flavoprotein subunit
MGSLDFNLVVIGSGSAGLSGALAAAFYVDMLRALSRTEKQSPRLPRDH